MAFDNIKVMNNIVRESTKIQNFISTLTKSLNHFQRVKVMRTCKTNHLHVHVYHRR